MANKRIFICVMCILSILLSSCLASREKGERPMNEMPMPSEENENDHVKYKDLTAEAWLSSVEGCDYKGYTFTVITSKSKRFVPDEKMTGMVDPTLKKRNEMLEEKFNIDIREVYKDEETVLDELKESIASGIQYSDLLSVSMPTMAVAASSGWLMNLYSVPFFDTKAERMNTELVKRSTVNNTLYTLYDRSAMFEEQLNCVFVNTSLLKTGDEDNIIRSVKEKTWSWQELVAYAEAAAAETLNKRSPDLQNDVFGLTAYEEAEAFKLMLFASSGLSVFGNTYREQLSYELDDAKGDSVAKEINNIVSSKMFLNLNGEKAAKAFSQGRVAFFVCTVEYASALSGSRFDWQILPLPKFASTPERYNSVISSSSCGISVPVNQDDSVRTGKILNGICASSQVGLEEALKANYITFCLKNNDSAIMLNRIFESPATDVSILYSEGFEGLSAFSKLVILEAINKGTSFAKLFRKHSGELAKAAKEFK